MWSNFNRILREWIDIDTTDNFCLNNPEYQRIRTLSSSSGKKKIERCTIRYEKNSAIYELNGLCLDEVIGKMRESILKDEKMVR